MSNLPVVQIGFPRTDRAINLKAEGADAAVARYEQNRSAKNRDLLPIVQGRRPRLWHVGLLTPSQAAEVLAAPNAVERYHKAFAYGCRSRIEPDGKLVEAKEDAAWLADCAAVGGGHALLEIGAVVLHRYQVGDIPEDDAEAATGADPFSLFVLPRGLTLPPSKAFAPSADAGSEKPSE